MASILVSTSVFLMLAAATAAGDRGPGVAPVLPARAASNPGTASLARFTLFGWVSPPIDFTTPERYAELANAGLNTTVLAWQDPGTPAENAKRLESTRPVGVRKNYYQETNEDALVMWVHDINSPEYAQLLAGLEARVPGETLYEPPKR